MSDKLDKELEEDTKNAILQGEEEALAEGASLEEGKHKGKKKEEADKVDTKDSDDDDKKDHDDKEHDKDDDHDDDDKDDKKKDKDDVEEAYREEDQPATETKDDTAKVVPGKKDGHDGKTPYIKGHDPKAVMPGSVDGADGGDQYIAGKDGTKVVPGAKLAKESVEKMFEDAPSLSPDFIKKAETIFEAVYNTAVETAREEIQEEVQADFDAKLAEHKKESAAKVKEYVDYATAKWLEENKVHVVPSIKSQIAEDFLDDFKALLESHNISIPEDKVDLLEEAQKERDELKEEVNTLTGNLIAKDKEIFEHKKDDVFGSLSEGLVETQVEKFKTLVEGVEANDIETFEEKAKTIRESMFKDSKDADSKASSLTEGAKTVTDKEEKPASSSVSSYIAHIKKHKDY